MMSFNIVNMELNSTYDPVSKDRGIHITETLAIL